LHIYIVWHYFYKNFLFKNSKNKVKHL